MLLPRFELFNWKSALALILALVLFSVGCIASLQHSGKTKQYNYEVLHEVQAIRQDQLPPTPEQLLLIEILGELEDMRADKKPVTARSVKAPVRTAKIATPPQPTKTTASAVWSDSAEKNRKQWRIWADQELARMRANRK